MAAREASPPAAEVACARQAEAAPAAEARREVWARQMTALGSSAEEWEESERSRPALFQRGETRRDETRRGGRIPKKEEESKKRVRWDQNQEQRERGEI